MQALPVRRLFPEHACLLAQVLGDESQPASPNCVSMLLDTCKATKPCPGTPVALVRPKPKTPCCSLRQQQRCAGASTAPHYRFAARWPATGLLIRSSTDATLTKRLPLKSTLQPCRQVAEGAPLALVHALQRYRSKGTSPDVDEAIAALKSIMVLAEASPDAVTALQVTRLRSHGPR